MQIDNLLNFATGGAPTGGQTPQAVPNGAPGEFSQMLGSMTAPPGGPPGAPPGAPPGITPDLLKAIEEALSNTPNATENPLDLPTAPSTSTDETIAPNPAMIDPTVAALLFQLGQTQAGIPLPTTPQAAPTQTSASLVTSVAVTTTPEAAPVINFTPTQLQAMAQVLLNQKISNVPIPTLPTEPVAQPTVQIEGAKQADNGPQVAENDVMAFLNPVQVAVQTDGGPAPMLVPNAPVVAPTNTGAKIEMLPDAPVTPMVPQTPVTDPQTQAPVVTQVAAQVVNEATPKAVKDNHKETPVDNAHMRQMTVGFSETMSNTWTTPAKTQTATAVQQTSPTVATTSEPTTPTTTPVATPVATTIQPQQGQSQTTQLKDTNESTGIKLGDKKVETFQLVGSAQKETTIPVVEGKTTDTLKVEDKVVTTPTTTTAPATPLEKLSAKPVDPKLNGVIDQIVDRSERLLATRKNGAITISLEPRDLGSITMTVRQAAEGMTADIRATNPMVRQHLEAHRTDLMNQVSTKGVSLNSVNISAGDGQSGQNAQKYQDQFDGHQEAQRQAQMRNALAAAPSSTTYAKPSSANSYRDSRSRMNYLI